MCPENVNNEYFNVQIAIDDTTFKLEKKFCQLLINPFTQFFIFLFRSQYLRRTTIVKRRHDGFLQRVSRLEIQHFDTVNLIVGKNVGKRHVSVYFSSQVFNHN